MNAAGRIADKGFEQRANRRANREAGRIDKTIIILHVSQNTEHRKCCQSYICQKLNPNFSAFWRRTGIPSSEKPYHFSNSKFSSEHSLVRSLVVLNSKLAVLYSWAVIPDTNNRVNKRRVLLWKRKQGYRNSKNILVTVKMPTFKYNDFARNLNHICKMWREHNIFCKN